MCGIAGIVNVRSGTASVEAVQRMCEILSHRGPDDTGQHVDDPAILGQARLSIIDLPGGHQPLSNEDGSVWVSCNGEIYNYRELQRELVQRGHRLGTSSDTEVLVHLYEDYGIDMVERLNGMFAFALWDAPHRLLYLVRDRLGIKPLYYSHSAQGLTFASEMKAVLSAPGVSRDIDLEAIAEYLTLGYITEPQTPFAAIRKLPRGTWIEYQGGQLREHRYWRVPVPSGATEGTSIPKLSEEIRFLIEDSTRLQLRSDVPIGVSASGGIDSTAIMWAASRQQISLKAFLCEFDDLKKDTPYARIAAAATGMRLTEARVTQLDAAKLLPKLIWHQDEPLADPALIPCFLISQQAAKQVKVILNGTGGDELFGGYGRYTVRGALPMRWSAQSGRMLATARGGAAGRKLAAILDTRQRYLRRMTVLPEADVRRALGLRGRSKVQDTVDQLFRECPNEDAAGAMMYVDLNTYLPGDLLMLLDKMTMAVSLESRVPLLDHRIVEFAAGIPGKVKMRGGLKWLLREALRGHVPDGILDRPKQGFGPPLPHWIEGALGASARKLLVSDGSRVAQLIGAKRLRSWLAGAGGAKQLADTRVWLLLVLELWWRAFVDDLDLSQSNVHELALSGRALCS